VAAQIEALVVVVVVQRRNTSRGFVHRKRAALAAAIERVCPPVVDYYYCPKRSRLSGETLSASSVSMTRMNLLTMDDLNLIDVVDTAVFFVVGVLSGGADVVVLGGFSRILNTRI
jgi:hypothetical protein